MICGIDEAGRGCVAGDLCIAGCVLCGEITGLNDSKKLSEKKREILYEEITQNSQYLIVSFSSADIDKMGLSACLRQGLEKIKEHFANLYKNVQNFSLDESKIDTYEKSKNLHFIYDGNTNFGVNSVATLIKADAKVPSVSAASILAKVTHDRAIRKYDEIYPHYDLAKNKGYASKTHIEMIKKHGYSEFHRKSYRLKALESGLFDE